MLRPDLGKLVNGVFQGASINTILLSNNGVYTSSTLPTLTYTTDPKYNSSITYSAGSGANLTPVLSGSPSITTSTKITYNLNDYQIYKGKGDSRAKPSFTWLNDTNTGMYHPADNQIGFTIDGTEVVNPVCEP